VTWISNFDIPIESAKNDIFDKDYKQVELVSTL